MARSLVQIAASRMVRDPRVFGREQGKDQIHRLPINGIIIQRPLQPQKDAADPVDFFEPGMRQGEPMSHAGRPQAFALLQPLDDGRSREAIGLRRDLAQLLKQALFGRHLADEPDGAGDQ